MPKQISKILITAFFFALILQLACLLFLSAAPKISQAAGATGSWDENTGVNFVPQVGIDTTFQKDQPYAISKDTKAIGEYIKSIYKYAIGAVGILAAIVLMFGGIIWITAGGSAEKIGEAKAWITASLTGLVIALCSYMILYTVNPQLVNFKITTIKTVTGTDTGTGTGCCEQTNGVCEINISKNECESKGTFKAGTYQCKDSKCIQDAGGCCRWKESGSLYHTGGCDWVNSKTICDSGPGDYYLGKTCNEVEGCPQEGSVCDGTNNGTACGANEICWEGNCIACKINSEWCSFSTCCAGLCCDESQTPDTCIAGTPTNGKFCPEW